MSKRRILKVVLEDILEEIARIRRFTVNVNTFEEFVVWDVVVNKLSEIEKAVRFLLRMEK